MSKLNYEAIKQGLAAYPNEHVSIFIDYLKKLTTEKNRENQLKNAWSYYLTDDQVISLFKKVAVDKLYIEGDTITLIYKSGVTVNYNYQAYKNKLLKIYPETLFDVQNVYRGDTFSFKKHSGKVIYTHDISDPFAEERELIGCYCIIKNSRGEFIETLNKPEIQKMRNVAKTKAIWNEWESEMTLKSVIKRGCKRHFKDVVVNIELLDNENYDLELVSVESTIQDKIEKATTLEDLGILYDEYKDTVEDEPNFISLLAARKLEIQKMNANDNS